MIAAVRAELYRLARRRTAVIGAGVAAIFATIAAWAVFASATAGAGTGPRSTTGGASLARLAAAGGGTESFAIGVGLASLLPFVTAIALSAGEFGSGTFRSLVLRNPRRLELVVGKFIGLVLVLGVVLVVAEVLTLVASIVMANRYSVPTGAWWSGAGARAAARDLATTFLGLTGWLALGTCLGLLVRSVPVALAVGVAWAGPFENIVVDSWSTGFRVFPGQVLRAVINGGTAQLGWATASWRAAVYVAIAAVTALVSVARRDVS